MLSELTSYAGLVPSLAGTYLLHSTLTLLVAWLLLTLNRRSWSLRERVWRWATIIPFITTAAMFLIADDSPQPADVAPAPIAVTTPGVFESSALRGFERPIVERPTQVIDEPVQMESLTASTDVSALDIDTPADFEACARQLAAWGGVVPEHRP